MIQRANGPETTSTSVHPQPEARAINPLYADPAVSESVSPHEYTVGRYGKDDYIIPGSRKRAINPVYVHGGKPEQGEHQYKISRYEDADYIVPGSRRTLRAEVIEDVDFALYFPRPAAINPKYLGHSGEALYKRAESGPLYGSGGQPVHTDVHQSGSAMLRAKTNAHLSDEPGLRLLLILGCCSVQRFGVDHFDDRSFRRLLRHFIRPGGPLQLPVLRSGRVYDFPLGYG